ncbi:hypothetical protein [Maribacter sp. HTCC2170]|uniref:hypothetical protein n=1 Tax=Maribacter sp. (strain HTCC2170 / KCCM 42371) TaxID=313603 RepID=UPI00006B4885|nr:hypothetical protein [Maribacter sp. HTCC2170]EAR01626.1 hypothetical protein FB2170_13898 [Maribacter sp. HTCC2170]
MITNKKIATLFLLLFVATLSFAQRRPDKEKIKSLKVAYITERLDLTSSEAQAFWPIYNAHEERMEAFRQQERTQIYAKLRDMESLSDKEIDDLFQDLVSLEKQKHEVRQQFLKDIRKVVSAKKTFLLLKTENGFKRRLLKQYRQKHGGDPK